ncbi:MAG: Fur family transcriptional regulator [Pseudomonadota bacterium]
MEPVDHHTVKSAGEISVGLEAHDHHACKRDALSVAEALCHGRGVRLTQVRKRVLELIWESHAPLGAYEILERLAREQRSAKPPTVYRALAFLVEQGLVHRIDSRNAFVGCALQGEPHRAGFLICTRCGNVAEFEHQGVAKAITEVAQASDFRIERQTIEVAGTCQRCLEDA